MCKVSEQRCRLCKLDIEAFNNSLPKKDDDSRNFKHITGSFFLVSVAIVSLRVNFLRVPEGEEGKPKFFHHLTAHTDALFYSQGFLSRQRDTTLTFGDILGPVVKLHWQQWG